MFFDILPVVRYDTAGFFCAKPFLKELKGKTLITADGSTLLGADDKAGIAEDVYKRQPRSLPTAFR